MIDLIGLKQFLVLLFNCFSILISHFDIEVILCEEHILVRRKPPELSFLNKHIKSRNLLKGGLAEGFSHNLDVPLKRISRCCIFIVFFNDNCMN